MLQLQRQGPMRNAYGNMNQTQHGDAVTAINSLTDTAIWRGAGTIISQGTVRIDVQGYTSDGDLNLQVQINGVSGNSTVAAILVAPSVGEANTQAQHVYATRKLKNALFESMNDGDIYRVFGTPV
ncbi:MAG: hypothetical protein LPK20_13240 [Halomonas sp.]|uniref:Uncharacterized protein n=1 Tax=Billgrantia tianxiuensis TaxID=2497861 RepID=A0A6I6SP68_9GAMM|nr:MULTISPECIES: hypothetical protein [Halomonas]MCE8034447.1 hypothetical protein [Halomonas sp. MCCC 1A11057]MDX5434525.1 hypothetical protein [Halomonas sp.]QHC50336.1 hypothetical protein EKK97_13145 [Halomonas tianxiuensis]